MAKEDNLIWVDLEMTGLDPFRDYILEIATVVTDPQLEVLAEGPVIAVHQSEHVLAAMDDWNTRHHTQSGLIERVRNSSCDERQAERETLTFVEKWCVARQSPLCGNSICQDRRFLARWMPRLESFMHYRNLDVSTLKELAVRWAPQVLSGFRKNASHLALEDVRDSIRELQFYREQLFRALPAVC